MMDLAALTKCLGDELIKKVFYAGANRDGKIIKLYVPDAKTFATHPRMIKNGAGIKISSTNSLKLENARSLEEMLRRLPHDHILLDPTATIERAKALVGIAKQSRQELGALLKGCYFDTEKRLLHFMIKPQGELDVAALHKQLEPVFSAHTTGLSHPFHFGLSLSAREPMGCVIAVDKASVRNRFISNMLERAFRKLRFPLLVASATSLGLANAAQASSTTPAAQAATSTTAAAQAPSSPPPGNSAYAQQQAQIAQAQSENIVVSPPDAGVAYVNGWLGAFGGAWRTREFYFNNSSQNPDRTGYIVAGEGGVALPLWRFLAMQIDGFDGVVEHQNFLNAEGYLFWRDPARGMIAGHYRYAQTPHVYANFYGLRLDAFLGNWTATVEGGDVHTNRWHSQRYGDVMLNWYVFPDWRIDAGYFNMGGNYVGQVGTEYQFSLGALPGLSVFADAGGGNRDVRYAYAGLRIYFGHNKSLERRQREDMIDPGLDLIAVSELEHKVPHFHS